MEKLQQQLKSNLTSGVVGRHPGQVPSSCRCCFSVLVAHWWSIESQTGREDSSDCLGMRLESRPCQFPSHYILPAGIVKRTKEIFSCSTFLHFLLVFIFLSIFVISSKYFPSLRPQLSLSTKKEPREKRKMLIEETFSQKIKYINQQEDVIRWWSKLVTTEMLWY